MGGKVISWKKKRIPKQRKNNDTAASHSANYGPEEKSKEKSKGGSYLKKTPFSYQRLKLQTGSTNQKPTTVNKNRSIS